MSIKKTIMQRVTILPRYKKKYSEMDYLWLVETLQQVATGEGTHSLHLLMMDLHKIELKDEDYNGLFAAYTKVAIKIKDKMTPMSTDEIIKCILNTTFILSILKSRHPALKSDIDKILQKSVWDDYQDLIRTWSLGINTAAKVNTKHSEGSVQAYQTKYTKEPNHDHNHKQRNTPPIAYATTVIPEINNNQYKGKGSTRSPNPYVKVLDFSINEYTMYIKME